MKHSFPGRWERSQRMIPDDTLVRIRDLYLRWSLTVEDGDLEEPAGEVSSVAAERVCTKIAGAPAADRPMIEKIVEDMLDGFRRAATAVC